MEGGPTHQGREGDGSSREGATDSNGSSPRKTDEQEAASSSKDAGCNLIINYLPSAMSEEGLRYLFAPFGEVTSCKLMRDRETGHSLGYGFIQFKDADSARASIKDLNGKSLENKRLKVSYARPSSSDIQHANLYVSKLDPSVTKEKIDEIFSAYGTIIDSKVLIDPATGKSRGVGFVRYDTRMQAEAAIAALNGAQLPNMQQPLGVKFADTVDDKMKKRKPVGLIAPTQLPLTAPSVAALGTFGSYGGYGSVPRYSPYGPISGGQHYSQPIYGIGHDYGYSRAQMASAANPYGYGVHGDSGSGPPNSTFPYDTTTYQAPLSPGAAAGGQYCLFVYNLPSNSDENYLYRLFSPYGALHNVRLIRDLATGVCKGYGFVNFMKLEDAQQAIMGLNGFQIAPNKALQVSFKSHGKSSSIPYTPMPYAAS